MEPPVHPETEETVTFTDRREDRETAAPEEHAVPLPMVPPEDEETEPDIGNFSNFTASAEVAKIPDEDEEIRPHDPAVQEQVNKYRKFWKVDEATYRRVNQILRKQTYITAGEWAIARLCADFSIRGVLK